MVRIIVIGFALVAAVACDRTQCQEICDDFQDCTSDNFDVGNCRSDCEDRADSDQDYSANVNFCDGCLDDIDACPDEGSECHDTCNGVVLGTL